MKVAHGTHIIVADSETCLTLHNQGDWDLPDIRIVDVAKRTNPPTRDHGADRPGRYPTTPGQSAAVADPDWHDLAKIDAALDIAARVDELLASTDVILVADPRTLGRIRPRLGPSSHRLLEVGKDLTNMPLEAIEAVLLAHEP